MTGNMTVEQALQHVMNDPAAEWPMSEDDLIDKIMPLLSEAEIDRCFIAGVKDEYDNSPVVDMKTLAVRRELKKHGFM